MTALTGRQRLGVSGDIIRTILVLPRLALIQRAGKCDGAHDALQNDHVAVRRSRRLLCEAQASVHICSGQKPIVCDLIRVKTIPSFLLRENQMAREKQHLIGRLLVRKTCDKVRSEGSG